MIKIRISPLHDIEEIEDNESVAKLIDHTYTQYLEGCGDTNDDALEDLKLKVKNRIQALMNIDWNDITID